MPEQSLSILMPESGLCVSGLALCGMTSETNNLGASECVDNRGGAVEGN
jgi:hypothetical protein